MAGRAERLDRAAAEVVALRALAFIAAEPARLDRFLALSGLSAAEIRTQAGEPAFLGGVLDFLLSDDGLVLAFVEEAGLACDTPLKARSLLPGA